jgi:hypothetical protein
MYYTCNALISAVIIRISRGPHIATFREVVNRFE